MTLTTAAGGFIIFLLSVSDAAKLPSVSVSPSGEIMEGSSVTLTCSSDANPAANYTWYKKNGDLRPLSEEPQLVLQSIQSSDSGQYYCTAQNKLGDQTSGYVSIDVKYIPKIHPVSVTPAGEIMEKSSVTLTCSSDANPAAKYTWYKGNRNLKPVIEEHQLVFSSIQSSDSGQYYCAAENKLGRTYGYVSIDVKYAAKLPSVSVSPSGEIMEGSSVTLTCSSDANPAAKYTWYKKNGNPYLNPLSEEHQLVFWSIQSSDSGQYYCTAQNKLGGQTSAYVSIDVKYAPKVHPVSVTPAGEIEEKNSVTLTCSSDANPAAKYTWYKQNRDPYLPPLSEEPQLVFSSIQSSDSGQYYCSARNHLGARTSGSVSIQVKYAPKLPSVSVSPSGEIVEGSSVTLTCSSDANPAAYYTWYKKNRKPHLRKDLQLVLWSIQPSDSGWYYCTAENELGRTSKYVSINVKYAPKLPSVSVSPSGEIMEGSSVTLNCSSDANPAARYTWYKNRKPHLRKDPQFVFSSIQSSDSGEYYCTAENKLRKETSQSIFITVKYAPKLPSVSVSPSGEIMEGSSVTLTCSSDANPAAKYTWYKENQPLLPEPGPKGIYGFTSISSEDRGNYYCRTENQHGRINSTSLFINVQYAPKLPSVSVSPSAEIVEGSSVTLNCSSDANPAANYTWYKENEDSPAASGPIFTITDSRPGHSGNYSCEAQNKRGRHISTLYLTVGAGAWKLVAVATVPAVFLAIIFISVFLWITKKKSSKQLSEPEERPVIRDQMQPAEQQDELHYATVHFTKRQTDPLPSNIRPAQPRRHKEEKKEEEEEMVVYTAVKFNSAGPASSGQEAEEDAAALYSTVNKKRNL